jgi:hypothetical protein
VFGRGLSWKRFGKGEKEEKSGPHLEFEDDEIDDDDVKKEKVEKPTKFTDRFSNPLKKTGKTPKPEGRFSKGSGVGQIRGIGGRVSGKFGRGRRRLKNPIKNNPLKNIGIGKTFALKTPENGEPASEQSLTPKIPKSPETGSKIDALSGKRFGGFGLKDIFQNIVDQPSEED